jgi:hypothetical protein
MQVLRDRCPLHFAQRTELVPAAQHSGCEQLQDDYYVFKRGFNFTPFSYCFQCGLPQSKGRNGEEPSCHAGYSYRKGETCPFAGFIFKAVFCVWQIPGFRKIMIRDIAPERKLSTVQEFSAWAVEEDADDGKYNNCLEAFLWFCREVENVKPEFFI